MVTHRYSKEYYNENRKRILENQRNYYIQKKRFKKDKEDATKRNKRLILKNKPLDIPLSNLNKKELLNLPLLKKLECRNCHKIFTNYKSKIFCSEECKKEKLKKNGKKCAKRYYTKQMTNNNFIIKNRLRDVFRWGRKFYKSNLKVMASEIIDYPKVIKHLNPCPGDIKNYHIDHIRPMSSFNWNDINEIKAAFHYSNLQWLLIKENLKKAKKYTRQ